MNLVLARRTLSLEGPPRIMGIVNATDDSFYDRSGSADPEPAIARGVELHAAGAALLDVGGMTAQPGEPVTAEEEARRVVPVIAGLRAHTDAVVSVDTYRATVADAALAAGAELVNDYTGLSDPRMAAVVAEHDAGLVVTHFGLRPKQAQGPRYAVTVEEIAGHLADGVRRAQAAGVREDALLVDPGLGFGKDAASDLQTLRRLPELARIGPPLLLACSHKEVTAEPLGVGEAALEGTAAVVAIAAYLGVVGVLRLHDLPFMARVATMGWLLRPR